MATFQIVTDGFISNTYKIKYGFQSIAGENTIRNIDGNKKGLIVTISANGKSDQTFYHEIECFDENKNYPLKDRFPTQEEIEITLQSLANSYESNK